MKNNVISERDFDVYKIPLPVRFIRKKKRESFLNGELEKLHPRFSAKDFYDAKISLEKGRLVANVAVMNRLTFAKYKNNAGGKLLLLSGNGIKSRPIFTAKEKQIKEIGILIAILVFGSAILGFGFHNFTKKGGFYGFRELDTQDQDLGEKILEQKTAFKREAAESIEKCQKVFESVLENGGLVTNFSVSKNQAGFKLKNCYPEKVFASENCTVSYQNGKPMFEVRISGAGTMAHEGILALYGDSVGDGDFLSAVRGRVLECGGSVKSEMHGNEKAVLSFEVGTQDMKKTLNAIRIMEIEKSWCEKSLEVSVSPEGVAIFNLEFLPFSSEESFCNLIASFSEAFIDKNLMKANERMNLAPKNQKIRSVGEIASMNKGSGNMAFGQKIGTIRGADGKTIYYFRGNDGKIRKEAVGE